MLLVLSRVRLWYIMMFDHAAHVLKRIDMF